MSTDRYYELRVSAYKILRETDEEYPVYLLAALLAAKKDGIDVNALIERLRSLKTAETVFELHG